MQGKLIFLGTSDARGVPVLGCECPVCCSNSENDKRLRSSVLFNFDSISILVDSGPDLREQALKYDIVHVTAVILTNGFFDHIYGIDDLRSYVVYQDANLPIYTSEETIEQLKASFAYLFFRKDNVPTYTIFPSKPEINISSIKVQTFPLISSKMAPIGIRIGDTAYITHCEGVKEEGYAALKGIKILIIGGVGGQEDHGFAIIDKTLGEIAKIKPEIAYLTHISHEESHSQLEAYINQKMKSSPSLNGINISIAYDGLSIDVIF